VIVVDTMMIAQLVVRGDATDEALAVRAIDAEWAAPALWRSELRNVLATLVRAGDLELALALRSMAAAERAMGGRSWAVGSSSILELAAASGCTAYDCEFVALAVAHAVPLVTRDRQVLGAFPTVARTPTDYVNARRRVSG